MSRRKKSRRRFGAVRQLPSGRYQASYLGPDNERYNAPETFERSGDADRWLNLKESELLSEEWVNPTAGKVELGIYGRKWIEERPGLRIKTRELYRWLFTKLIEPQFGKVPIRSLTTPMIREWRAKHLVGGGSEIVLAKAYRLLRTILWTAVKEDKLRTTNPCNIRGADKEASPERPVLTVGQVYRLADLVCARPVGNITKLAEGRYRLRYRRPDGTRHVHPQEFPRRKSAEAELWRLGHAKEADTIRDDRFRLLVLLATFASLRWGEVSALRRRDIDLDNGLVHVRAAFVQLHNGGLQLGPPKSRAGVRTVTIPSRVVAEVKSHLAKYTESDDNALVFTGITGKPLRRGGFQQLTGWTYAAAEIGMSGLHFHDLRHTGNNLAADTGTSTKNLMARMGHDDQKAALRYQHRSKEADRAIADALDQLMTNDKPTAGTAERVTRNRDLLGRLARLLDECEEGEEASKTGS